MEKIRFEDDLELTDVLSEEDLDKVETTIDEMPEETVMQLRMASYEAIIEDIVETHIEDNDDVLDDAVVEEEIEVMLNKAISLALIPSTFKNRVPHILARYRKVQDPILQLSARVSDCIVDRYAKVTCEVETYDPLDDAAKELDMDAEIIDPIEDIDMEVTTPDTITKSLQMLKSSSLNKKKAYSYANASVSQKLARNALHELRNHLPARIKKKYGV